MKAKQQLCSALANLTNLSPLKNLKMVTNWTFLISLGALKINMKTIYWLLAPTKKWSFGTWMIEAPSRSLFTRALFCVPSLMTLSFASQVAAQISVFVYGGSTREKLSTFICCQNLSQHSNLIMPEQDLSLVSLMVNCMCLRPSLTNLSICRR